MNRFVLWIVLGCLPAVSLVGCSGQQQRLNPLDCALSIANTIEQPPSKAEALAEIGEKYMSAGQPDRASQYLQQALSEARSIPDAAIKAAVLSSIAGHYAKAGQRDKAGEIFAEALKQTESS